MYSLKIRFGEVVIDQRLITKAIIKYHKNLLGFSNNEEHMLEVRFLMLDWCSMIRYDYVI